jgi:hypothetical protein
MPFRDAGRRRHRATDGPGRVDERVLREGDDLTLPDRFGDRPLPAAATFAPAPPR